MRSTLSPLPGQDIVAPFLLLPERGVVVTATGSNAGLEMSFQHHPDEDDPLYLNVSWRECQLWAQVETGWLAGGGHPAIRRVLARCGQAPRSGRDPCAALWGKEERLGVDAQAGLTLRPMGCCCPCPKNRAGEKDIEQGTAALRHRSKTMRLRLDVGSARSAAPICYQAPAQPREPKAPARKPTSSAVVSTCELILACLISAACLFGDYVQASGAISNYLAIDLRQIISESNLFQPGAACLCRPA